MITKPGSTGLMAMAIIVVSVALLLTTANSVAQQPKKDPQREALQRLQSANQKLERERADAVREKSELEEKLKAATDATTANATAAAAASSSAQRAQRDAVAFEVRRRAAVEADLERARSELAAEREMVRQLRQEALAQAEQLRERNDAFSQERRKLTTEMQAMQKAGERERSEFSVKQGERDNTVKTLQSGLRECQSQNVKLYRVGRELLERYEKKTCGEIVREQEPFTRLKRVELENQLEGYRDRLDDGRHVPAR